MPKSRKTLRQNTLLLNTLYIKSMLLAIFSHKFSLSHRPHKPARHQFPDINYNSTRLQKSGGKYIRKPETAKSSTCLNFKSGRFPSVQVPYSAGSADAKNVAEMPCLSHLFCLQIPVKKDQFNSKGKIGDRFLITAKDLEIDSNIQFLFTEIFDIEEKASGILCPNAFAKYCIFLFI